MLEEMKRSIAILTALLLGGCATGHQGQDYRCKVPIQLPPSAEALLLKHQHATHVVDVQTLVFQRKNYADFLIASVTINLTKGDFAGWFHQTYVFERSLSDKDWSEATLFCFTNSDDRPVIAAEELLTLPENQVRQYLRPAPVWR